MFVPSYASSRTCNFVSSRAAGSCHYHGLDVDELLDAVGGEFTPVAAFLDVSEWHPRIGTNVVIDKDHSCFDLEFGDLFPASKIAGDEGAAIASASLRVGMIAATIGLNATKVLRASVRTG